MILILFSNGTINCYILCDNKYGCYGKININCTSVMATTFDIETSCNMSKFYLMHSTNNIKYIL